MNALSIFSITLWVVMTILVYFDAKAIGIHKTGEKAQTGKLLVDTGPFGWMFVCFILGIFCFPLYLVKRAQHLAQRRSDEARGATARCPSCQLPLSITPDLSGSTV